MKKILTLMILLLITRVNAQDILGNKTFDTIMQENNDGTTTVRYIEHDTGKELKSYTYNTPKHVTTTTIQPQQIPKLDTQTIIAIIFTVVTIVILILWKLGTPEVNQENE